MFHVKRYSLILLAMTLLLSTLTVSYAQDEPVEPITLGETTTVTVEAPGEEVFVDVPLVIEEPEFYSMIARAAEDDGTDPVLVMLAPDGREMAFITDNPAADESQNPGDAVLDDVFLIPDTYTMRIQRTDSAGSGEIEVTAVLGEGDVLGVGQLEIFEEEIASGERLRLTIPFEAGTIFSIAAVAPEEDPDLLIELYNPDGILVATNDDHETADLVVGDFDPKIERFITAEDGDYVIEIAGFGAGDDGSFKVIFTRFGVIQGDPSEDVLRGESLVRQRNTVSFDAEAGEVLTIIARADNSSIDPEITLLDPDRIIIGVNDDHDTNDESLGIFDSLIADYIVQKSGTYSLNVDSISGRGPFEVLVQRQGIIEMIEFEEFDPDTIERIAPPEIEADETDEAGDADSSEETPEADE